MQNILFYLKKYSKDCTLFLLIIFCLSITIYNTFIKDANSNVALNDIAYAKLENDISNSAVEDNKKEILIENFFVDVKGAVKNPGVYQATSGMIVDDIIKLAGGFKTDAYKDGINLSKKVNAEMVIYVYTKTEMQNYSDATNNKLNNSTVCNTSDYSICECIQDKHSIIQVGENEDKGNLNSEQQKVNINTATIQELTTLTGVGESKAQAIIQYREDNGKFIKIEDIMNVSGIGEKAFEKIKDFITV